MNVPIMKGTSGLYTQSDSAKSVYNSKRGGLNDLAACINIDVSDRRRPSRRRGITRKVASAAHSLCPVNDRYCLFVSGADLNLLQPDLVSYTTVGTVTPGMIVSAFVLDGICYWQNGIERGKIISGSNEPWELTQDVVSANKTRVFTGPPRGERLAYYNGRVFIGSGSEVWYSEPYAPDVFSMGDSFLPFESDVQMLRAVSGGLYISDSEQTWALIGSDPGDFKWGVVDNHPALPYSDQSFVGSMQIDVEGDYVFLDSGKLECAFWLTDTGIMFGDAAGSVYNISTAKIDLPGPYSSGSMLVDGTALVAQFIK